MILYVCAMEDEARFIKNELSQHEMLIITGVGKVNAARALTEALVKYPIDIIINLGFAGASGDYDVCDVVLIEEARYHDVDLTMFNYEKGQIPGYPASYTSDKHLISIVKKKLQTLKLGVLMTGDYFMTSHYDQSLIYDMEGASLFHVAHYYQKPMLSLKVISDIVGSKDHLKAYKAFEAQEGANAILNIYKALKGGLQ